MKGYQGIRKGIRDEPNCKAIKVIMHTIFKRGGGNPLWLEYGVSGRRIFLNFCNLICY